MHLKSYSGWNPTVPTSINFLMSPTAVCIYIKAKTAPKYEYIHMSMMNVLLVKRTYKNSGTFEMLDWNKFQRYKNIVCMYVCIYVYVLQLRVHVALSKLHSYMLVNRRVYDIYK